MTIWSFFYLDNGFSSWNNQLLQISQLLRGLTDIKTICHVRYVLNTLRATIDDLSVLLNRDFVFTEHLLNHIKLTQPMRSAFHLLLMLFRLTCYGFYGIKSKSTKKSTAQTCSKRRNGGRIRKDPSSDFLSCGGLVGSRMCTIFWKIAQISLLSLRKEHL